MANIDADLRQAWQHHEAVDRALMHALETADLSLATPGAGWTIEQQLAHMAAVVVFWSGHLDAGTVAGLDRIDQDEPAPDAFDGDLAGVACFLGRANAAALEAADRVEDWRERSHLSAISFLTHMTVHAAHDRAQVTLALKEAGRPLPNDGHMWGPWKRDAEAGASRTNDRTRTTGPPPPE